MYYEEYYMQQLAYTFKNVDVMKDKKKAELFHLKEAYDN